MIKYKIRGSDWLKFPLIIVNINYFFIQPAPDLHDDDFRITNDDNIEKMNM